MPDRHLVNHILVTVGFTTIFFSVLYLVVVTSIPTTHDFPRLEFLRTEENRIEGIEFNLTLVSAYPWYEGENQDVTLLLTLQQSNNSGVALILSSNLHVYYVTEDLWERYTNTWNHSLTTNSEFSDEFGILVRGSGHSARVVNIKGGFEVLVDSGTESKVLELGGSWQLPRKVPISIPYEIRRLTGFDVNGVVTILPATYFVFIVALGILECLGSFEHDRSMVRGYLEEFRKQLKKE